MRQPGYESFNPDRIGTAFSFAIAFHAALILGITFTHPEITQKATQLEVTLSQFKQEVAPKKADYLADQAQEASGEHDEKALLSAPEMAELHDTEIRDVTQLQRQRQKQRQQASDDSHPLFTTADARKVAFEKNIEELDQNEEASDADDARQTPEDIASMPAKLAEQAQARAKKPRVRRVTSVSAQKAMDAIYLLKWERRIERLGNLNYPTEARENKLYGSLRLLVVITPNGAVESVDILESSGHAVLDQAAIRIVKLAAPFDPFSEEMRGEIDKLEIMRTWQFQKNLVTANQS